MDTSHLYPVSTIVDSAFDILDIPVPGCLAANGFNSLLERRATLLWQGCCVTNVRYKRNMFRISITETPSRRTLIVEGTLLGAWVAELVATWRNASKELNGRKLVIDVSNLTVISREGEDAIFDLMQKGVRFSCGGVLTRHVLKKLTRKKQQESRRR